MDKTTGTEGVTPTMLATTAAIALWGRHPVLLIGGIEAVPAEELGKAMMETLKTTERGHIVAADVPPGSGCGDEHDTGRLVAAEAGDPVFGGTPSENTGVAEMAHQGVLTADDVQNWKDHDLARLYTAAAKGRVTIGHDPKREHLCDCQVIGSITGCRCSSRALRCECDEEARDGAARSFWNGIPYFLFDISCNGPMEDIELDTKQLAEQLGNARRFFQTEQDGQRPNARTEPAADSGRWKPTREGRTAMERIGGEREYRQRLLQVARSSADVRRSRRITETDIETAAVLTRHLHPGWNTPVGDRRRRAEAITGATTSQENEGSAQTSAGNQRGKAENGAAMRRIQYDLPSNWRAYARQLRMSDVAYAQQVADRTARQWNRPVDVTDGTAGKLASAERRETKEATAANSETAQPGG